MAQLFIDIDEIYSVTVESGRYDYEDGMKIPCEFCDHAGYPKYFTTFDEAITEYNAIKLDDTGEYPQRKSIKIIPLWEGESHDSQKNY